MATTPAKPASPILQAEPLVNELIEQFTSARRRRSIRKPTPVVTKAIVAVHGIGDQVRNETILATTVRVCDTFGYPGMVPLGAFYRATPPTNPPGEPALVISDPPDTPGLTGAVAFAEAHWADIARKVCTDGYTLQETKAWARSIVNRVRVMATQRAGGGAPIDFEQVQTVLEEMIGCIGIVEALLFLADKAGLGKFELKTILDSYLGDVQLVTEFAPIRAEIVGRFHDTIAAVAQRFPDAEVHIIAHSEGTVVSLLGLLEAHHDATQHPWIDRVRTFVTLGSPIDKHLILWPTLFDRFRGPVYAPAARIQWLNYVDNADPVGFDLDTARQWLTERGYDRVFAFSPADDFSFYRYAVPGAAHVGYWKDSQVFDHAIRLAIAPDPHAPPAEQAWLRDGPHSRPWVPLVSYGLAYVLPIALIHVGVFVLVKAIAGFLQPEATQSPPDLVKTVLGLGWLVCGTTFWLRLIRLTRSWLWFAIGAALYFAGAIVFLALVRQSTAPKPLLSWFEPVAWPTGWFVLTLSAAFIAVMLLINRLPRRRRRP